MRTLILPLSKQLKTSFSFCCCHAPTAQQHITVCIVTFVTISSQICSSCQNGTSTANVELQKYNLNCKCRAANVSCCICSSTANVSTAYVAGRICVNCKKGKLLKCEQRMCSCKSVELLMFQWHMNKTANVVTGKHFNCLCIQLQLCYQQMYDLQMKNCICTSGQCRFTLSKTSKKEMSKNLNS